jgi:ribonuclease J
MNDSIKIIPLGGFDKIGMNMTLVESDDSIIAIDCGMSFPPENMPGVTGIIPDVTYIKKNIDKFKGIVLTHGHEDHIGAIPYIASEIKAPIYGTPLTIAMVENRLSDFGITGIKTRAVKLGNTIIVGGFKVEFISANHSIPDSAMLAIYTPCGTIISTGDFKIDMSPVIGATGDIARLSVLGTKGVLAVLSDSTNALREGTSGSELHVYEQLRRFFNIYSHNRLIIVTFATNMDRIQEIINLCKSYGRRVVLEGKLMLDVFAIARKLGYITVDEDVLLDINLMNQYPDEEIVIVTTGNPGESVQCIAGIAAGTHESIRIVQKDVILFSSVAIHGNELMFNRTLNSLEEKGAIVQFQDLHTTGHACCEELKLLYKIIHPQFIIPAHGDYRSRREAKKIACEVGVPSENVMLISNGDVVKMNNDTCQVVDRFTLNDILVDGYEKSRIDTSIIQERQNLSKSGVIIIELCVEKKFGRCISDIRVEGRGFMGGEPLTALSDKIKELAIKEYTRFLGQGVRDNRVRDGIRKLAEDEIFTTCGKLPVVIVMITEVVL